MDEMTTAELLRDIDDIERGRVTLTGPADAYYLNNHRLALVAELKRRRDVPPASAAATGAAAMATTLRSNQTTRALVDRIADRLVEDGEAATAAWLDRTNRGEGLTLATPTRHGSVVVHEGVRLMQAELDALLAAARGALDLGLVGAPEFWSADLNTLAAQGGAR